MKQYIIPAVLTFIFGVLLWQIQRDKTELTYNINDSELFPLDSAVAKFYVFNLKNTGNKEIENIDMDIEFSNSIIQNYNTSDLQNTKFAQENSKIFGRIMLLNPNEELKIKCTVIGDSGKLEKFSARAKGITATKESLIDYTSIFIYLIVTFGLLLIGFYYLIYKQIRFDRVIKSIDLESIEAERINLNNTVNEKLNQSEIDRESWLVDINREREERNRQIQESLERIKEEQKQREKEHEEFMKRIQEEDEESERMQKELAQGKPDRNLLIFRCLNRHGLTFLYFKVLNLGDGMTYLNTGFIIFIDFLKNNDEKYLKAIQNLTEYDMAPTSKGMLYYLAGKMESKRNNHERVNYWLNKCKDEFPILYNFLMDNDENFNLNQLLQEIKVNGHNII